MKGNRSSETAPERALRSALHVKGFRFFKNRRPDPAVRCRADIVFPVVRVAVFVDGCFWHRCPIHGNDPNTNATYWKAKLDRNVQRDRDNDVALRSAGWTVVHVWEHQDPQLAAKEIAAVVVSQRAWLVASNAYTDRAG
jgi:DNA mismatch endonuclease (patch repair protein)